MKHIKTINEIIYSPIGYEFMDDVFSDLSDNGFDVEINKYTDSLCIEIHINNKDRRRYDYFKLGNIIKDIEFAIGYLKDEYKMDILFISFGVHIVNHPTLPLSSINGWGIASEKMVDGVRLGFSLPLRKIK